MNWRLGRWPDLLSLKQINNNHLSFTLKDKQIYIKFSLHFHTFFIHVIHSSYSACLLWERVREEEEEEEKTDTKEEEEARHPDTGRFSSPKACSFFSTRWQSSPSKCLCRSWTEKKTCWDEWTLIQGPTL